MPKDKYLPEQITTIYEQNVPRSFQEAARKKLTRRSLSLITNINNAMRDKIREVLREGVSKGNSVSAVASSLLTTGLDKGVYHSARKRAWMIAKTELHRARQRGAITIYKYNKINQVQWVVISDNRICDRCEGRSGRVYRIKDLNEENMPPIHVRCRCRLLPTDYQVSIKVKHGHEGKVLETKISPTPQNYKYVIKIKKSLEDIEKAKPHKYIRREGGSGAYKYFYDIPKGKDESKSIKTVGLGISAQFAKEKFIDLRGHKVSSAQDVAELAQIYRNPKYETFRYIYVKNGVVVGHEGRSCHIPGFTLMFKPESRGKDLFEIKRRIARLGADEVWVLHNHPSGNPTPSSDDFRSIEWLSKKIPEIKGGIVINSGKYSLINAELGKFEQFDYETYDIKTDEKILQKLIENPLLGHIIRSKDDVSEVALALKSPIGFTTVLYRTPLGEVRAIQEIPTKMLNHYEASLNYFRGRMREFGSQEILIADSGNSKLEGQGYQNILRMVTDGDILDDVKFDDVSGRVLESVRDGIQPKPQKNMWMGLPVKTYVTKSLDLEKGKQVQVKPYQRKGKYVVGYSKFDPRDKKIPIVLQKPIYKGISAEGLRDAMSSGYLEPQYERWPGEEPSHYFTTDIKAGKQYTLTTASGEPGELLRIKSTKAKFEPDPEGEKGSIRTYDKIPISDVEIFKNGKWNPIIKSSLDIEKGKQVQVKPYQRKGKYVIGYHRLDPREKIGDPYITGRLTDKEPIEGSKIESQEISNIVGMVSRAIKENSGRMTHGYTDEKGRSRDTGWSGFFIVSDKIYQYNKWLEIPKDDTKKAISFHSHSPSNWEVGEDFQPLNSEDIHIWFKGFKTGLMGNKNGIIMADGRMEILEITSETNPLIFNFGAKRLEKELHKNYDERSIYYEEHKDDPNYTSSQQTRELLRDFCKKYGIRYYENLNWKVGNHEHGKVLETDPREIDSKFPMSSSKITKVFHQSDSGELKLGKDIYGLGEGYFVSRKKLPKNFYGKKDITLSIKQGTNIFDFQKWAKENNIKLMVLPEIRAEIIKKAKNIAKDEGYDGIEIMPDDIWVFDKASFDQVLVKSLDTTKLDKALERIDYLLKAVQVKGFTRTRKGKMERVKPFSRDQTVKEVERLKAKEPIEVGGKLFKQSDRSKKWKEEVVLVDVSKFDADWSKDEGYYVSSGKGVIGNRIESFKEFLETGKPIEMAEVSARPEGLTSRVGFTNGRHRFAVLRDMGFKVIPVSVDKESAKVIKELFGSKIETVPDTQEPESFEEALGAAVREENRARHKVEDTNADSYPITEEKKETLRALRVASDHTDSLIAKNFNLALFKAEFDQHGLTDRTEALKYVIQSIRLINEKMNFDGKGILKVICTDLVSSEKDVLAEYFNDDVSIKINKKYENTLGHEYAHFLFSKSIMKGTTYPIADFNSILPPDPYAVIAIDGDAVSAFLEKVGNEFNLKQVSKEPFLELLSSLKELYSKKVGDATFTPKSFKYFFDVNEMFARAVEAYIDGEPGIISSGKFRVIEGNDEYYQLAKTWGDKYLKTGIVKSLEKAIQVKGFTRTRKGRLERVKPHSREGEIVFHGTQLERIKSIVQEGIISGKYSNFGGMQQGIRIGKVFVSKDSDDAIIFAKIAAEPTSRDFFESHPGATIQSVEQGEVLRWILEQEPKSMAILQIEIPEDYWLHNRLIDDQYKNINKEQTAFMLPKVNPEWIKAIYITKDPKSKNLDEWEKKSIDDFRKSGIILYVPISIKKLKQIINEKKEELEKSKQVQVKPYQRKGKYVIGYHRIDPREKIGEPFTVERMFESTEAFKIGSSLPREEALELWREYKSIAATPPEEHEKRAFRLQTLRERAFRLQTLREIVEGYIGSNKALTPYEIDEQLGMGYPFSTGVSQEQKIERQLDPARSDVKLALDVINDITDSGGRAIIVGGFVRDALLGKPSKDLDIEVYNLSPDKLKSILDKRGEVAQVGKSFGVFIFKSPELSEAIDVSLPRRESKIGKGHKGFQCDSDPTMTPEEAAKRRDLTVNSMGYDTNKKEFIDPYNGQEDLKNKILRAVDKETFGDDPLRVLRVMRFAGNLGFTIDPELVAICRGLSDSLEELPKERIYGEMEKLLLKSKKPSQGIQTIPLLGIKLFPELTDMIGVKQDPGWHPEGDCWTHALLAIDDAAKKKEQFADNKDKLIYMLATLLHDVGKPKTPGLNEKGRITHRKHSEVGAQMAVEFLKKRLTDEDVILSKVENLIRYHMTPTEFYNAKIADSAIRKLAKKLDIPMLVAVSSADKQGRGPSLRNKLTAEKWLMKRYHTLGLDKPEALKPIVMGRHLIELGIQPGPDMGKILSSLYESQLSGRFDTPESGIEFARRIGLLEPIQKGFYIGRNIAMKQLLELRKNKNNGKLIPMKDDGKIRWFKSFGKEGLWRKIKGSPVIGSTVLTKGKLSKVTAVGKDGITAVEREYGNKYKVLYKDVELMKSIEA